MELHPNYAPQYKLRHTHAHTHSTCPGELSEWMNFFPFVSPGQFKKFGGSKFANIIIFIFQTKKKKKTTEFLNCD